MTYRESLEWLYGTQTVGIKLGLENIRRLLAALGVAHAPEGPVGAPSGVAAPVVFHVAGTNGKGSVCAMLDAVCRAGGRRTGLFTSPHLVTFRERIRLNGAMIPEADVAAGLTRIRRLIDVERAAEFPAHPTFFELTCALALRWFADQRAEVIVLETGLGGRLDATNAVLAPPASATTPTTPAATLITALSLDHQYLLGGTLAEIAAEKAGIFKPGIPALSVPQPPEAARVLEAAAREAGTTLQWITAPAPHAPALAGSHQAWNAALALAALEAVGLVTTGLAVPPAEGSVHAGSRAAIPVAPIPDAAIREGLRNVVWPGRFQRIPRADGSEIILDGAHNEAAAQRLAQTWREEFGGQKSAENNPLPAAHRPTLILSILRDKEARAVCRAVAPLARRIIVTAVQNPRTHTPAELAEIVRAALAEAGQTAADIPCEQAENIAAALSLAEQSPCPVLVTGSLFLVGEALAMLEGTAAERSAQ